MGWPSPASARGDPGGMDIDDIAANEEEEEEEVEG